MQRACVHIRDLVTHGELAEYDAKFTSARTSRQIAAAIVGKLLESAGSRESPDYPDLIAEGVSHARAAIENPTTRAMLAGNRADLNLVRLAAAVLPAVTAAREWEQRETGNDALMGEDLVNAADRLLSTAAERRRPAGTRGVRAGLRHHCRPGAAS